MYIDLVNNTYSKNEFQAFIEKLMIDCEIDTKKDIQIQFKDNCLNTTYNDGIIQIILSYPNFNQPIIERKNDNIDIEEYFNNLILNNIDVVNDVKDNISFITKMLSIVASIYNIRCGNTVSLEQIINLYNNDSKFADIIKTNIDTDQKQVVDVENEIKDRLNIMVECMSSNRDYGTFRNFLNCGSAININQMGQLFNIVGFKPDINGLTIPKPINTSFLKGIDDLQDWVNCLKGARKASIINFSQVKNSGYLARKLLISTMDYIIDKEVETCDTKFPIKIKIDSKEKLKRLKNRKYKFNINDTEINTIKAGDNGLIGQEILLFTPMTCNAPNGICKTCYGDLWKINKDFNIGNIAQLNLSEQITQRLLSAKHLLQTNSKKINIDNEYMYLDQNELYLKEKSEFVISQDFIVEDNTILTQIFNKKTKEIFKFEDTLFINPKLINFDDTDVKTLDTNTNDLYLGYFEIVNNELNASLVKIINLIEKKKEDNDFTRLYNEFFDLLIVSKLKSDSVHIELTLRSLLSYIDDPYNKIDFSDADVLNKIEIITLDKSNLNASLARSLIYENQKAQLFDINIFEKKSKSLIDSIFIK